jgi:hypothetical protein
MFMAENDTQKVPGPDPDLQILSPLIGEWIAEDQTNDSPLGPGVKVTSREKFY